MFSVYVCMCVYACTCMCAYVYVCMCVGDYIQGPVLLLKVDVEWFETQAGLGLNTWFVSECMRA